MNSMTRLELPFPVPLHDLWISHKGGGGTPTARYKSYGKEAGWMILTQRPKKLKGPVTVQIFVVAPDNRTRDGDNLLKCLFDTLKTNGIIEDDNRKIVRKHSLEWVEDGPPCVVIVKPYAPALQLEGSTL